VRPVGIGLAGLGRWGRNYVKTLLALPECRLVAMADADRAIRDRIATQTGIPVRESAEELLADPAVEAVVIATPDRTHCSLASTALAAGRDVLVEKPMALEPDEAKALSEQAESSSRVLAVGHTAAYGQGFEKLMDEIRAMPLDAKIRASAIRTSSGYADGRSNPILDLCPHDIALAVLLFGTPTAARARSHGKSVKYEVIFKGGRSLSGRAEWCEPQHVRRFEVAGAKSTLSDETGGPSNHDIRETPLGRQCLDFVECCRTRRQPLSSGRLGAHVVRCLGALASSARNGGGWLDLYEPPTSDEGIPVTDSEPAQLTIGVRA
jgi:predicted dehydrogenase